MSVIARLADQRVRLAEKPLPQNGKRRWLILQQGGPANVLGAILQRMAKELPSDVELYGVEDGLEGFFDGGRCVQLTTRNTRGMTLSGACPLGTTRFNPQATDRQRIIADLARWQVECLFMAGGDDTQKTASRLSGAGEKQVGVIGLAKTVDDDLPGIELTYGHLTAINAAARELQVYGNEAQANNLMHLTEISGRNSGALTMRASRKAGVHWAFINEMFTREGLCQLAAAIQRGDMRAQKVLLYLADLVLINGKTCSADWIRENISQSELPVHAKLSAIRAFYLKIQAQRKAAGFPYSNFAIAEGVAETLPNEIIDWDEATGLPKRWRVFVFSQQSFISADEHNNPKFSDIRVGRPLAVALELNPERYYHDLTYEVRCARPVRADIELAQAFGSLAVHLADSRQYGKMVGWTGGRAVAVPFSELPFNPVTGKLIPRRVDLGGDEFLSWQEEMMGGVDI